MSEKYQATIELNGDVETKYDPDTFKTEEIKVEGVDLLKWLYDRIQFLDKASVSITIKNFEVF